ncbi:glycosyltransferase [Actinoplanes sp. NPDC051513]|uniref:glycosyltransferase n=1 Tax=Actinoplanes sp. NPDC051513 TaxID=3363908 RepID=UPI0037B6CB64
MRVLHVISTLSAGGPEHQLRLLVSRLPHESEVVTLSPPGAVAAALRAGGTTVHELSGRRDLATVGPLRRLIRRGRFDLVHTHMRRASVPGRFAARLAGVPRVVATEHQLAGENGRLRDVLDSGHPATGHGERRGRFHDQLYLAGERLGQVTIAASPAIAAQLQGWGVPESRIAVIPKAVDAGEFRFDPGLRATARARLGIAPGAAVVGGVGRLEPTERFDRLIRAVGEVPGATLLLVGDGPARDALEKLAAIEGIADRVVFAGPVAHAREMLCAMDVFASPSEETSGLVVLESLAAGLPALYARCEPLGPRPTVEGVKRLTPHDRESLPRALRAELLCCEERQFHRLPPRTASSRYGADHLADEVARVYEQAGRR